MKSSIWMSAVLIALCGSATPLRASLIFNTFPYQDNVGYTIAGTNEGGYHAVAFSFQPTKTAAVGYINLAAFYSFGTNSFVVDLKSDNSGTPGLVLESFTTQLDSTGKDYVTLTSSLHPLLQQGTTYWLEVLPGASDTLGGWNDDSSGVTGTEFQQFNSSGTSTGKNFNVPEGGYQIADLNGFTATPEPASLTLLGGIGLGLFGYGWRRRRQRA